MTYQQAFNSFIESDNCERTIDSSTKAGWGGSGYSVELFEDGTYRTHWDSNIGNRYDSPGVIMSVPGLDDDDWSDDPDLRFYDNAIEYMRDAFEEMCEDYQISQ